MSEPTKTIVVLGAAYAGLNVAHKLLKKTLDSQKDYKLVLVSPNTHLYWNIAAVRAVVPGQLKDDQIFSDIRPAFKQYPANKFQHVLGLATDLSTSSKTITVKKTDGLVYEQKYDILVIATGSRSAAPGPWKQRLDGYDATVKELHDVQSAVAKAKTIVIGGGGPTGVETASEIKFEYKGQKEVTIITAGKKLVSPTVPDSVHTASANELRKLGVKVVYSTRVTSSTTLPSGQTELTLDNGEKKVADLYLSTVGVINNTEFVPTEFLNEKKEVVVDEFFKVKGTDNVWAVGDAASAQPNQMAFAQMQAPVVAANIDAYLKGTYSSLKPYKPVGAMIAVTLGRSKGTGHFGNFKFPSLVVWAMKGRNLFLPNMKPLVGGTA